MVLKTGIIGMGTMGRLRKRIAEKHPGFQVVAISDINEQIAEEFPNLFFTNKWEELLKQDLDVVFVCTYNKVIPKIVISALNRGIHVFAEKPPGRTVEDVLEMKMVKELHSELILKFGFNHRFHSSIMEAKAIVDSKIYGNIVCARGVYGKAGGLGFAECWRSDKDIAGGGILLDQGIHMLDLLRYFMGEFTQVKSFVENLVWNEINMEDNAFAIMKTAENKVAMVQSSATQWKHKFLLEIMFERGYVVIDGLLTGSRSYGEERIVFAKRQFEDEGVLGKPKEEEIHFDEDHSWEYELKEFYECIKGKITHMNGDIDDALATMQLVYTIYESASKE